MSNSATLQTEACQTSLPMGLSRKKYWSGLSCPLLGDLLNPGSNLLLLCLLHWQVGSLLPVPLGNIYIYIYLHTHTVEYYLLIISFRKSEILPLTTTKMNLEGIMLSEISQTKKDKHSRSHLYIVHKNKQTNPRSKIDRTN